MLFSFVRLSTFLSVCGSVFPPGTPKTFKVLASFMLSAIVSMNLGINIDVDNLYKFITLIITEVLNGFFLGYVTYLALNIIQIAGSLIDTQIGLSMATIYDPQTKNQSSLMQRLFYWLSIALLFATNGHHLLIDGIFKSFETMPIGTLPVLDNVQYILNLFVTYFSIGFQMSIPVVLTLIISDLVLGLISRSVPQLNVMIVGMPLKLLVGIVVILISLPFITNELNKIIANIPKIMNGYM